MEAALLPKKDRRCQGRYLKTPRCGRSTQGPQDILARSLTERVVSGKGLPQYGQTGFEFCRAPPRGQDGAHRIPLGVEQVDHPALKEISVEQDCGAFGRGGVRTVLAPIRDRQVEPTVAVQIASGDSGPQP